MDLKDTKTLENLHAALSGESIARNKYSYFAAHARKCGEDEIADLFDRLAVNEMMHARAWFNFIFGTSDSVGTDLEIAQKGEFSEWHDMYPAFAQQAREEGLDDIAVMFERVAEIERDHEMQFMAAQAKLLAKGGAPRAAQPNAKAPKMVEHPGYRCQFCGTVSDTRPDVCGVCGAIGSFDACTYLKKEK